MCGIAGIIDKTTSKDKITLPILTKMSDVISHRGPDSDGQFISEDRSCGFTFRRLAIIDLSLNGSQPMTSRDGRYTIVFNGEIYNHAVIRAALEAKGYEYHSETDTETILYGFIEWGPDVIKKFVGMWGLAVWDDREKTLFVARDRIGVKPLYYYAKDGLFVFGSEIKSILAHPAVPKQLNRDEIPNYLNLGTSAYGSTLFAGISKLPAGHRLFINADGDIRTERWWSPFENAAEYTSLSDKEIQEHVLALLRQAVKDRMMSDVPFGVFLSGGVDSSLNVALMAELMNRPVDTFTVGFKELTEYNELEYANKIADLYSTNHHEILIDDKDALPVLSDLAWHEDEPNADPVCIPLYFLSKLTKASGTTVIQVGEGSDEQFVGYKWMRQGYDFSNSLYKHYQSLPSSLRKGLYSLAKPFIEAEKQFLASEYMRRGTEGLPFNWSGVPIIGPAFQEYLFNKDKASLIQKADEFALRLHTEGKSIKADADYLQQNLFIELHQRLAELLLMRVDKITMAHSLEARVPFLDHRLVEFTMTIPPAKRVPKDKPSKFILKKAVEGLLPHDIIYRKKQGFAAPVHSWFRNQWKDYAESVILNGKMNKELELFDEKRLEKILAAHARGKRNFGSEIYALLNLNLWYGRFFGS